MPDRDQAAARDLFPTREWAGVDDIVIVGGGLAGLFCALKLAPRPVTVITAAPIGDGGSSAWAQGGIAAAISEQDTPEAHVRDTVAAGAGLVDEAVALSMAREARARIEDLLAYGVPFDRDIEGKLALGREAAHGTRRIVHVRGDVAGRAIMAALVAAVRRTPSIRVIEGFALESLLREGPRVTGLVVRALGGKAANTVSVPAEAVVLATGGIGHLYAATTNPPEANGHGLAAAAIAGAAIADPEFVQFHPTALDLGLDPAPLATEALRGEGAILVNRAGHRFMLDVHPDAELAPRDIVARAVFKEIASGRGAFLDTRRAIGAAMPERFPTVTAACRKVGLDPVTEPMPIAPAAHYHMGGVLVDAFGRTTLDGLWACGEVACTGAHGANRLASNSLLEAIVFAARVAEHVRERAQLPRVAPLPSAVGLEPQQGQTEEADIVRALRATMSTEVGVTREAHGLHAALGRIAQLRAIARGPSVANMLVAALLVAAAALKREESRGAHHRADFPHARPEWRKRTVLTLAEAERIAQDVAAPVGASDQ